MEDHVMPGCPEKEKCFVSETDPPPPRPDTHWRVALLVMVFCCTPCGIIALISAYQAEDHYDERDYAGAVKLSKRALRWIKASVLFWIIGQVVVVLYVIFSIIIRSQ